MAFAPQPIISKQFGVDTMLELPKELRVMLSTVKNKYARGIAVVSEEHKSTWPDDIFDGGNDEYSFTQPNKLPGPSPTPQQCAKIVRLARRCEEHRACEAAWNSSVHNLILDTALDYHAFINAVYFVNSTSARIFPSLIPPGRAGTSLDAKMIDFAIHMEPNPRFNSALHVLAQRSSPLEPFSTNCTPYAPLCARPIGVSIETKLTGEKWEDVLLQVEVWAASSFVRMEHLVADCAAAHGGGGGGYDGEDKDKDEDEDEDEDKDQVGSNLPFLPILIIQGHDWNFLAAVRQTSMDGDKRITKTCVYHKVAFGSTTSLLGVYQVICTIQLLATWVRDDYTPWFESRCLGLDSVERL
ncbi:hypothetical protein EJ08DRAFT_703686 [Tothia fuscella]|uniref:PD-(D/E)XK nuclease-like domain-containing protein n=1 Tax=Tothia fuscella TaxID=1048955 RepID=A0A9P4TSA0_9PEZI|nr:hypothetical protein EJ08DRAFT_703686 [Tothia fuscella]